MLIDINELLGKTFVKVERQRNGGDDSILFVTGDGEEYIMEHHQDCCESVSIEDISGDLNDLVGSPITKAEESKNSSNKGDDGDSQTWTFYHFATVNGYVTIRWYGTSNGYYSETASIYKCESN